MLIGIDASRANRPEKTGVEWYAFHLLKHFYDLDTQNIYHLYTNNRLATELIPDVPNFKEKLLNWPFGRFWTLGRMSLEMIIKKPDILFIPSHTFPLIGGKKNVITWHDIGYEKYPETYSPWDLASLKQGAKRAFRIADKIITLSEFTKAEMVRICKVDPERIKVIHPGCNHARWQPIADEQISKIKNKHHLSKPYFIFLSRLSLRKNPLGMIRMYNAFREQVKIPHHLLLIGRKEPYHQQIDEEIKASPFKDEIIKMGWLPPHDLPALLSGAQALVFPSIYEGFGLPTIEAMACGCPVIASNAGSLPEVIRNAGLLAKAHDIETFAKHMQNITENASLKQDLIKKGFIRSKEFTWERCAKETLEILLSV